jgi:hypothetical protein
VAPVCATHATEVVIQATRLLRATASTVPRQFMHTCFAASAAPARFLRAVLAGAPQLAMKSGCSCKPRAVSCHLIKPLTTARWPVRTQTRQAAGVRQRETHAEGTRQCTRRAVHVYGKTARPACAHVCQLAAQAEAHSILQGCLGMGMITGCCVAPFAMFARALLMMCASTTTCPWRMKWLWL